MLCTYKKFGRGGIIDDEIKARWIAFMFLLAFIKLPWTTVGDPSLRIFCVHSSLQPLSWVAGSKHKCTSFGSTVNFPKNKNGNWEVKTNL
jgi:hypothetical protein